MKLKKLAVLIAAAGISAPAFATNGMNMEGYGPIATAMGGASYAYDNGAAGMINNPATIGLMKSGTARLDIAIGGLHPDVNTSFMGMNAASAGDAYYMPAAGYVRKDGKLAYGIGMMAQGGMGTEYGSNSLLNQGRSMAGTPLGTGGTLNSVGYENRSELGLGRIMVPLSFEVTDGFQIGGSIDYLWGGLDIRMVMDGNTLGGMMMGTSALGRATPDATLGAALAAFTPPGGDFYWAQFDFSQGSNKFKQRLTTTGWAANLGFTWKATPQLTIGGVYHAKTHLSDMEGRGQLVMSGNNGANVTMSMPGKLKVIDFQWPETFGIGLAYQASDSLLIVADYKRINWSKVMQSFRMRFEADGGGAMDAALYQNWSDQDVYMIGGAYKVSPALTLRAGVNLANNPVPAGNMNPLFPATIKNHYTFGFGYAFSPVSSIDFSLVHAPKVTVTNNNMGGVSTSHSQQNNWQFMYSHRF
ncbi:MAG: outer membrane protein transport protein [Rhodocyclaceae bacterium]|nr:outer membrane protein transport protein [Rhodocyclaceae bacterium]